ncbi:hypothetical protein [Comamonas sp. C24C]
MQALSVTFLDLTFRMGAYVLEQLGISGSEGQDAWENMPLRGVSDASKISWYRVLKAADLERIPCKPNPIAILVGPGSFSMLPAVLGHNTILSASIVWILTLPNALMEDIEISQYLAEHPHMNTQKYQLQLSDPQSLWSVLMEQLSKLKKNNEHKGSEKKLIKNIKHFNQEGSESELRKPNKIKANFSKQGRERELTKLKIVNENINFNGEGSKSNMSTNLKASIDTAMTIDGALAAALVDYRSGMCLAQAGGGLNLDLAAAGNRQVVQAKLQTMKSLGISCNIEDMLITLADQYHLIRLVPNAVGLFLYLVLDRNKGNLALARYQLMDIERTLKV